MYRLKGIGTYIIKKKYSGNQNVFPMNISLGENQKVSFGRKHVRILYMYFVCILFHIKEKETKKRLIEENFGINIVI